MRRIAPDRVSPFKAGVIAIVIIVVATYFIFTKAIPFRHHYSIRAVFANANLIAPKNPVRIDGIDVGQVSSIARYENTNLSVVTMTIDNNGRPVHTDATMKIRPRLFLEGNFFIDLNPGTPNAKEMPDGGLIPLAQTSRPVQLDQVLDALQTDSRSSLQQALQGYGDALDSKPSAADNAEQDPAVRGLTGAQAFNKTYNTSPESLRGSAIVNNALQGEQPSDIARIISGFQRASSALVSRESDITSLVADFNTTMAALASQSSALQQTIALLGPTAANARAGFASLDSALGPTDQFSRDLIPGVLETPATIAAGTPWVAQAAPFLSKAELGGLLNQLQPGTKYLAQLGHYTRQFLPVIDEFNRCVIKNLIPMGNTMLNDTPSANVESYKEFWYSTVALAGQGQGFDANGPYLRIAAAGGPHLIETGQTNYDGFPLYANATLPPLRTRPAFPNAVPKLNRDVPCYTQPLPDFNGPASVGPADGSDPNAPPPPVPFDPSAAAAKSPGTP